HGAAGRGDFTAFGTALVLWLIVALRVGMLAVRSWREPIRASFGVGMAVLFVETLAVPRAGPEGRLFAVIVPLFFLGSLAFRGASVWIAGRPAVAAARDRVARPVRNLVVLLAVLSVALGAALGLGAPGGA